MSKTKVTVVIPYYKGEDYLEESILTILAQTYSDFDILIINDGCPVTSQNFFEKVSLLDSRINVLHQKNGGVACARQYGIANATGELIAFCDQDDHWLPTKLEKQIPLFSNPKVGLVYTGAIEKHISRNLSIELPLYEQYRGNVFFELLKRNEIVSCTAVARKDLLIKVDAFDSDIELMGVDDWLAWLKLSLVSDVEYVDEYLAIHIFHDSNYSSNHEMMYRAELICLSKIAQFVKDGDFGLDLNLSEIKSSIHSKYAEAFVNSGSFKQGGDAYLLLGQTFSRQWMKGIFYRYTPVFLLKILQKTKRKLASK